MRKEQNENEAVLLVLQHESRRMREAAERVDLVVRAVTLRAGLKPLDLNAGAAGQRQT